ncbi:MAG: hypothetical protein OEW67_10370 [Cyclobacteriaceae bacterium]|nr:hypothetical protein [Cyclobacteriaceae bacterium]
MIKKVIIGAGILIVGAAVYFYLGGMDEIIISHKENDGYEIVGINYEGRYRSEELEQIYFDVKQKKETGELEGELVVVNYKLGGDSIENGFIKQFLGIQLSKANQKIPEGFTLKVIESKMIISVNISAHNLVMPNPNKIGQKINKYASENNLERVNFTIEKYVSDRELIIEVPIIE